MKNNIVVDTKRKIEVALQQRVQSLVEEYTLRKKRFFNQRSAGTFEEPLKGLGRTCKGSSKCGRTFKGST